MSKPEERVKRRGVQILETLHRAEEPLTTQEIADRLGTTRKKVARSAATMIDADLLEVVRGVGKPNQYTLASLREEGE